MEPITYFNGVVGDSECRITSKIWSFGNHHIPTHAVSDVEAKRFYPRIGYIICGIVALAALIIAIAGDVYEWLALLFAAIIVVLLLKTKIVVSVMSKGSQHVMIEAKGNSKKDAVDLYLAMLKCLNEGEPYSVNLSVFNESSETKESKEGDQVSTITETVNKQDTLIVCPECGTAVPKDAPKCPNCGCPAEMLNKQ